MSRIYDNWERLVGAALKRERFREMALAPPSRESSFSSRQSDLSSFASSSRHDELGVGNSATGATPGGVAARAALLFAAPLAYYRRRKQQDHSFDFRDEVYLGQLKRFSLRELEVATDNFSDKNSIGRGGYGKVYKGRLADGTLVAVKRLRQERTQDGETQFQTEVEMISMAVHRNLQRLHGFCITPTERLLVYPYMANGSVASWLRDGNSATGATIGNSATGATIGGVAARAALLFAAPLAYYRRRKQQDPSFDFGAGVYLGHLERFSLLELQVASDNFSHKNSIGRGGYGKVYKGRLADGTLVAVKRLKDERTQDGERQFQMEVETISMAVHRNLQRLHGFCMTPTERLLVYPYMANGSVASWLRERPESQPPLDWHIRKRIAAGSARGLAYLHEDCDRKIIHCDIKAANIFLDEEFEAVVGDFGLAKLMDHKDTHVTTVVRGTIGHIAPEYLSTGKISEKTDVFGYGVMLLELFSGQRAFDLARLPNDEDVMLLDWVKGLLGEKKLETIVDADLKGNYIDKEMKQLIQVALLCTQAWPDNRPKMSDVVGMLEGDGLAERCKWYQWQLEEMYRDTHHPNTDWIILSSDDMRADELSGPR